MAALASLTAQYTDSENEGDASPDSQNSTASLVIIPPKRPTPTPTKQDEENKRSKEKKKKRAKKVRRLVSYQDDTLISDEDEDHAAVSSSEEESSSGDESNSSNSQSEDSPKAKDKSSAGSGSKDGDAPMEVDEEPACFPVEERTAESYEKDAKYAKYKFQLPPEPKGKPSAELVAKITKMYTKMSQTNMDMNRVIQDRKEFRNPSIYDKLISFCDINEFGTNYPPEIYDPLQWGEESYYESLAAVQKTEMVKRQKDRKDMDKVEQATALARKVEEEAKKRKSKWDQPAPSSTVVKTTLPALTTTVTGTKGTVISAFGSLPKKPAV
ncbi:SAP30-binding protein [Drosophila sechellia]|uniref:GM20614 n=1 Tax=Drosophila sechellia TaxID=7238 RepID=B4HSQ5_DROSE|nr:SAP30-binding protein [Drosophila sechellia]EDW47082.1 GM20614 [Drosophila sechellia]